MPIPNPGVKPLDRFRLQPLVRSRRRIDLPGGIDQSREYAIVDGTLGLFDAVAVLRYLFVKGDTPACLAAADVNDTGKIDLSAPVALLNYLFPDGPNPHVPFPNAGIDPTADLPCS